LWLLVLISVCNSLIIMFWYDVVTRYIEQSARDNGELILNNSELIFQYLAKDHMLIRTIKDHRCTAMSQEKQDWPLYVEMLDWVSVAASIYI